MNKIRSLVCILLGLVVAAFALPSFGAPQFTKQYSLTLTSSPSTPLTVVVDLTNKALGPGNSNIGSFQFTFTGATIALDQLGQPKVTTVPAIPPGTVSVNGSTIFVTGIAPLKATKHFILTIVLNDCGDGISLKQSGVQVWTGNMGQTFSPTTDTTFPLTASVSCGDIACGDGQGEGGPIVVPDSLNPGTVEVERGTWDKNGNIAGACSGIPYYVTNNIATNDQVHFRWLVSGAGSDEAAAFLFTAFGTGGIPAETDVAWFNTDGSPASSPGTPDFIPGLPCNAYANFLPTPYGTLISDDGSTTLHVNTTVGGVAAVPTTFPFDVFIQDERLTISAVNATNLADEIWTVSARNVGGIAGTVPHTALNLLIMSEPLPIMSITQGAVSEYVAGNQAQMCISDQTYDGDSDTHTTTFIDIGDGWGGHP